MSNHHRKLQTIIHAIVIIHDIVQTPEIDNLHIDTLVLDNLQIHGPHVKIFVLEIVFLI